MYCLKGLIRKNERGYRIKPKHFRSSLQPIYEFYLMFLSREIDIKMYQPYTNQRYTDRDT